MKDHEYVKLYGALLNNDRLGLIGAALYGYIEYRSNLPQGCTESLQTISRSLGVGRTTIVQYRKVLIDLGYVSSESRGQRQSTCLRVTTRLSDDLARTAGDHARSGGDLVDEPLGQEPTDTRSPGDHKKEVKESVKDKEEPQRTLNNASSVLDTTSQSTRAASRPKVLVGIGESSTTREPRHELSEEDLARYRSLLDPPSGGVSYSEKPVAKAEPLEMPANPSGSFEVVTRGVGIYHVYENGYEELVKTVPYN